jgi:hypothetical protein
MTPLYNSKQVLTEDSIDYFLAMEDLDKVAEKMNVSAHTLKNYLYGKSQIQNMPFYLVQAISEYAYSSQEIRPNYRTTDIEIFHQLQLQFLNGKLVTNDSELVSIEYSMNHFDSETIQYYFIDVTDFRSWVNRLSDLTYKLGRSLDSVRFVYYDPNHVTEGLLITKNMMKSLSFDRQSMVVTLEDQMTYFHYFLNEKLMDVLTHDESSISKVLNYPTYAILSNYFYDLNDDQLSNLYKLDIKTLPIREDVLREFIENIPTDSLKQQSYVMDIITNLYKLDNPHVEELSIIRSFVSNQKVMDGLAVIAYHTLEPVYQKFLMIYG